MHFDLGENNYTNAVVQIPPLGVSVDSTPNDSDKTIVVPNGERWKLNHAFVTFTADGTAGNRQLVFEVSVGGLLFGRVSAGAVQAASTTRYYQFLQGIYREIGFINNEIQVPVPQEVSLPAGTVVRFYDQAAISAAGDTMIVRMSYQRFVGVPVPS